MTPKVMQWWIGVTNRFGGERISVWLQPLRADEFDETIHVLEAAPVLELMERMAEVIRMELNLGETSNVVLEFEAFKKEIGNG